MNIQEEIRSLSRISERFRKSKKPKSKWPVEFQLRVLHLIDQGLSPQVLSRKLKIPVQTYYHWRRLWKSRPKTRAGFIELPESDKLSDCHDGRSRSSSMALVFPNGMRLENISEDVLSRILENAI